MSTKSIRLFLNNSLEENSLLTLDQDQTHYLLNVLRMGEGDHLSVFNGQDGEWHAQINSFSKKACTLLVLSPFKTQPHASLKSLIFSPIRHHRLEFMIEKATEMGVTDFYPIITNHSSVRQLKVERLRRIVIEASEQCERLTVPRFSPLTSLENFLGSWDKTKSIYLGLERLQQADKVPSTQRGGDSAVMVGPEGGFTSVEINMLRNCPFIYAVSLGNHILRSETAAIGLLAISSFYL